MALAYSFKLAIQSLFREKWINLLSILTIAAGLLIISLAFFSAYNFDVATKKLPEKFSMIMYLDDNLPREKIDYMIDSFAKNSAVNSVRYISKEEAMNQLKVSLKDSDYIFEGLEENPLPDSLEIKLRKEALGPETAKKLGEDALRINGVTEVDYGEKFLSTIHHLRAGLTTIGTILIVILSVGIIFVCYSTVKILFYRKKEEIETLKLLGATKGFISAPFIIEGAIIGASGGFLSLLGVLTFNYMVLSRLSITIPIFRTIHFPANLFLSLPIVGIFLGVTGAIIAIGRLKN